MHSANVNTTLATYAYPVLGSLPVAAVDTGLVMRVLEPIWSTKPETASRVRGQIKSVLDLAKVRGYRDGENPARWKGHLDSAIAEAREGWKSEAPRGDADTRRFRPSW